jgi:hypothetical protein
MIKRTHTTARRTTMMSFSRFILLILAIILNGFMRSWRLCAAVKHGERFPQLICRSFFGLLGITET